MNNKKTISILVIFTIIFTVIGSSLAAWNYQFSEEYKTNIVFTSEKDFSCAVDGGEPLESSSIVLFPTSCTSEENAIKRKIVVTSVLERTNMSLELDLWLNIDNLGTELSKTDNFRYALTTSENSCVDGIVSEGNFKDKKVGDKIILLERDNINVDITNTYYLYIWLDKKETNPDTSNQSFNLSLYGNCSEQYTYNELILNGSGPKLDEGMIPVTISADGIVTTADLSNEWYSYENKEWANAILVTDASRNTYLGTNGLTVNQDDILAYYVWIPRYSYKFPETCSSVNNPSPSIHGECYTRTMSDSDKELLANWLVSNFPSYMASYYSLELALEDVEEGLQTGKIKSVGSNGYSISYTFEDAVSSCNEESEEQITSYSIELNIDNVLLSSTPRSIDVKFESADSSMSVGDGVSSYMTHPAFWWDDDSDGVVDTGETVAGIWVGKFETSTNTDSTCYKADGPSVCLPADVSPRIVPNVKSLRNQTVSNQFITSRKFSASDNIYGINHTNVNAHMMKNSEWGAVAYLSHSVYGINQEIYPNNSEESYTGRSGGVATIGNSITYGSYTWLGQSVDTDGVIGGYASDTTLGTYASTTGNVYGIYDMPGPSARYEYVMGNYNDTIGSSGFDEMPAKKYYDVYSITSIDSCTLESCGGHALSETLEWYTDASGMVSSSSPWMKRGGGYSPHVVGVFSSYYDTGGGNSASTWRSVLVVGFGE